MSDFKFELNKEGVKQLMQSEEMQKVLIGYAKSVQNRAGEGYDVHVGKTRANVSIQTNSSEAMQDNLEKNTLLRSVRG